MNEHHKIKNSSVTYELKQQSSVYTSKSSYCCRWLSACYQ